MITEIKDTQAQNQLISDLKSGTNILVGAGISMILPSKLPSGIELKEIIANNLFKIKEIEHFSKVLNLNPKYEQIIPEVLFQEIYSIIGNRIYDAYEILKLSSPNNIHQILAEFCNQFNAIVYTTNFDLLIDRFVSKLENVTHLHGSLQNPELMTILVHQVGKGVEKKDKENFHKNTKGKNLYVFGYSGNDKDILDLINSSSVDSIFWLMRDVKDDWTLKNLGVVNKNIFVFQSDLYTFFQPVEKKLAISPIIFSEMKSDKEKKRIISDFNNSHTLFDRYATLELILFRVQEYQLAYEICKMGLNLKVSNDDYKQIWFLVAISDAIRILGNDFNSGFKYVNKGLNNSKINAFPFLKARLLNIKGLLFLENKKPNPTKATIEFEDSLVLFEDCLKKEKDKINRDRIIENLGKIYNNLGLCFFENKEYDKSIVSYKKSLNFKKRQGNLIGFSTTAVNLSICFLKVNNKKQALHWEKISLDIIEKYSLHYRKAYLMREKGRILGNNLGIKYLSDALQIYQKYIPSAAFDIELTLDFIKKING